MDSGFLDRFLHNLKFIMLLFAVVIVLIAVVLGCTVLSTVAVGVAVGYFIPFSREALAITLFIFFVFYVCIAGALVSALGDDD